MLFNLWPLDGSKVLLKLFLVRVEYATTGNSAALWLETVWGDFPNSSFNFMCAFKVVVNIVVNINQCVSIRT